MIKAVLLDLDDTLLRLDTDGFSRKYLTALGQYIVKRYPTVTPERFQTAVRGAIRATSSDLDPTRPNVLTMSGTFAEVLSLSSAEIDDTFNAYYAEVYSDLRGDAAPMEGGGALVNALRKRGYQIVVATNPVFPPGPVYDRLRWAGFAPETEGFALITTIDLLHFTKPTPHYYEEILARIGVEADDAIMVGDSLDNDIAPAKAAGLATFWVRPDHAHTETTAEPTDPATIPDGSGTLLDFKRCVEEGWLHAIAPRPRTAAQLAPRMIGNIAALHGLTAQLDATSWQVRPFADEWNPLELVCHLRDTENAVQRAQLWRIATEDNPFLPPAPPPPGPGAWNLNGIVGPEVVAQFWAERQKTLGWFETLTEADWKRPARHSIFGPTTLLEMAHFTARHDRLHINQLCEMIGFCRA